MATVQQLLPSMEVNKAIPHKPGVRQIVQLSTPQIESVLKLKQKYEKNVQQTIQIIQSLSHGKMPQKCLLHNNNYTLYCQYDHKPLCTSCVYQNNSHKSHTVSPLTNCSSELRKDCQKLQKQLVSMVYDLTGLVKHVNEGISKLQKEFPHLVWKIQDCYKAMHQFLVDKQKQQVNELKYYKQKIKYQNSALSAELNKIALYTQQKIDSYERKNETDILLVKRNVLDTLKFTSKIIRDEINTKQQGQAKLNFTIFNQIQDFLTAKIPQLISKNQKENNYNNSIKKRTSRQKLIRNQKSRQQLSASFKKGRKQMKNIQNHNLTPKVKQRSPINEQKNKSNKSLLGQNRTETIDKKSVSKTPPKKPSINKLNRQINKESISSSDKLKKYKRNNSKSSSKEKR